MVVVIGNKRFRKAMFDLGALVNVMHAYIYEALKYGSFERNTYGS